MGVRRGGKTVFCPPPWKLGLRTKKCWKIWSQYLDSDQFNSCNNTSFIGMALALHQSQLHCSGVVQWWACGSLTCRLTLRNLQRERIVVLFLLVA